jgi:hypothetical protein
VPGRGDSGDRWRGYRSLSTLTCYDPEGIRPPTKLNICENNSCIYYPLSGLNPGGQYRDDGTGR